MNSFTALRKGEPVSLLFLEETNGTVYGNLVIRRERRNEFFSCCVGEPLPSIFPSCFRFNGARKAAYGFNGCSGGHYQASSADFNTKD